MAEITEKEREALEIAIQASSEDEETEKEEQRQKWKIIFLCCIWFIISICSTGITNLLFNLKQWDVITTLTMVQFVSITLFTGLFIIFWDIPKSTKDISWVKWFTLIVPVVLSIFIRIRLEDFAWATPISDSFSLSVEAFVPLCMLTLARIILNEKRVPIPYILMLGMLGCAIVLYVPSRWVFLPEAPIYAVLISFEMVFSKKILKETGLHHSRLLFVFGCTLVVAYLPVFLADMWYRLRWTSFSIESLNSKVVILLILAGVLSWLQTIVAFTLISMVSTHCYVAASACNRIFRICTIAGILAWFFHRRFRVWDGEY